MYAWQTGVFFHRVHHTLTLGLMQRKLIHVYQPAWQEIIYTGINQSARFAED